MYYKELKEYYLDVSARISEFEKRNADPKNTLAKKSSGKYSYSVLLYSILDLFLLTLKLISIRFSKKKYSLIYTQANLCAFENNQYKERLVNNLKIENRIYINQGKEKIIKKIDSYSTYNIGGVVYFLSKFFSEKSVSLKLLRSYRATNNFILFLFPKKEVYLLCHYDQCGLSIVFSKHRKKINLIEVQHGGIVNYPAYSEPSSFKIADKFYIKNNETVDYLKMHLNKNFSNIEYEVIPYSSKETTYKEGVHILYASTIEINGIHSVFMEYLNSLAFSDNVFVSIRLHPREKEKKDLFEKQLQNVKTTIIFDETSSWLESNTIKNLIVVSPWSSIIEEAYDNNFKIFIIDEIGKKRFGYLIDNKNCFYTDNLKGLSENIMSK